MYTKRLFKLINCTNGRCEGAVEAKSELAAKRRFSKERYINWTFYTVVEV